jgi:uncharacterized protein YodC (DUF2158 family)
MTLREFQMGDLVRHVTGGPSSMVVVHILQDHKSGETINYSCTWMTGDERRTGTFTAWELVAVPKETLPSEDPVPTV